MDGLTLDGIVMGAITMGGITIDGITVERILPRETDLACIDIDLTGSVDPGAGFDPGADALHTNEAGTDDLHVDDLGAGIDPGVDEAGTDDLGVDDLRMDEAGTDDLRVDDLGVGVDAFPAQRTDWVDSPADAGAAVTRPVAAWAGPRSAPGTSGPALPEAGYAVPAPAGTTYADPVDTPDPADAEANADLMEAVWVDEVWVESVPAGSTWVEPDDTGTPWHPAERTGPVWIGADGAGTAWAGPGDTGSMRVDTMPGDADPADANAADANPTVVAVFDRAALDYDAEVHGVAFFRPLGRTLVCAAGIRPGEDVVDLATGRGAVLFPAAEATGPTGSVRGFDLAPTMVELTAADLHDRGLSWASVEVADAQHPALPAASVDVVLCGMGLFLLPEPAAALARWRELLRPGGRLAVSLFGAPDPLWDRPDYPLRRITSVGASQRRPGQAILAEGALAEALAAADLELIHDETVATDLVFRDVEHWWQWSWGTAVRTMLEKVDDADRAGVIRELTRWHAPSMDAGGLHWRPSIRIVTAVPRQRPVR